MWFSNFSPRSTGKRRKDNTHSQKDMHTEAHSSITQNAHNDSKRVLTDENLTAHNEVLFSNKYGY